MWKIAEDEYLCHHGIKGQKWGIRRFQNEDGSYTEAGKERYSRGNNRKQIGINDFKEKNGFLEYITDKEICSIADPLRLEYKYGINKKESVKRINKIRSDEKTIKRAKEACIENLNKFGPKFGNKKAENLEYIGTSINRNNEAEISFAVYRDEAKQNFAGISNAILDDEDKKPIYCDYGD